MTISKIEKGLTFIEDRKNNEKKSFADWIKKELFKSLFKGLKDHLFKKRLNLSKSHKLKFYKS